MKRTKLLFGALGVFLCGSLSAQIIPAANIDNPVYGTVDNTGIAIAPYYHWNAMAYDDPSMTNYQIDWRDATTMALLDTDVQPGYNPDVAYYSNADVVVVAYENGGDIFVDDYYLWTVTPTNYNLNTNNYVSSGTNANVDINSAGNGVLTWEDGGMVYATTFGVGPFTAGPIVPIAPGTQPDIVLLDGNKRVVITYVDGGQLFVDVYQYNQLVAGTAALIASNVFPPIGLGHEHPRVAGQRNSAFGPTSYFTVVDQEDKGGLDYDVNGYFFQGPTTVTPILVNDGASTCATFEPKPVVTYDRTEVHVAWGQRYSAGCSPFGSSAEDVLLGEFDFWGANLNGPTTYRQVNQLVSSFRESSTSLNTEYDGGYGITATNYCEGVLYNDPGDTFWKVRDVGTTIFRSEDDNVEVIKEVTSQDITVNFENGVEGEAPTFELFDNTGRKVELTSVEQLGNTYRLNTGNLVNGMYILRCAHGASVKTERLMHYAQ